MINPQDIKHKEKFYGRTRGRNMSDRDRYLLNQILPQFSIAKSGDSYLNTDIPLNLDSVFGNPLHSTSSVSSPLWMEIGFGGGEHLAQQAMANPHVNMIGCEPFTKGVCKLLTMIEENAIPNIRIWQHDARPLLDRMPPNSVDRLFLLFNDPWPKKRHHFRRFIPHNLDRMARVMKPGAELRLAHDHMEYFGWMLYHTLHHPAFAWTAKTASHWRNRPADSFPTRYEEKGRKQGRQSLYLSFVRA